MIQQKTPDILSMIEQRFSEISVPIIYDEKVLGVIDCEHSKKWFFTQKHLSILTTIASLCANKIVRARAEEEKKEAQEHSNGYTTKNDGSGNAGIEGTDESSFYF